MNVLFPSFSNALPLHYATLGKEKAVPWGGTAFLTAGFPYLSSETVLVTE